MSCLEVGTNVAQQSKIESFSKMARGAVTCLIIFFIICSFLKVKGQKDIILLNEENWTDILKDEWMVELQVSIYFS